jgi:hypothetical protein
MASRRRAGIKSEPPSPKLRRFVNPFDGMRLRRFIKAKSRVAAARLPFSSPFSPFGWSIQPKVLCTIELTKSQGKAVRYFIGAKNGPFEGSGPSASLRASEWRVTSRRRHRAQGGAKREKSLMSRAFGTAEAVPLRETSQHKAARRGSGTRGILTANGWAEAQPS